MSEADADAEQPALRQLKQAGLELEPGSFPRLQSERTLERNTRACGEDWARQKKLRACQNEIKIPVHGRESMESGGRCETTEKVFIKKHIWNPMV